MDTTSLTPRQRSLELLRQALKTGIRGRNREAIASALETLEDDGHGGLTDLHYKRLPVGQTLRDPDRRGLWMRRNKKGGVWLINYTADGKTCVRQFATYPETSLVGAREKWEGYRTQINEGCDPFTEEADATTVKALCKRFIDEYAKVHKRSWKEDQRMFDFDLVLAYGDKVAVGLTRDDVEALLDEIIERGSPRSAEKLLTATRKLYNHAIKKRWIKLSANPCLHIELQKRHTETPFLNEAQIKNFLNKLPAVVPDTVRDIFLMQFQTVTRIGEVCGLTWDELDLKNGIWNLPGERSKNKQSHRIMLSKQTLKLLNSRDKESDYVFPAPRSNQPYSTTLIARFLRDNRKALATPPGFTSHGLRHTAQTQLASLGCGKELRDRISNHKDRSVDAIYMHYEHDKEAREWWQTWADRLDELAANKKRAQKGKQDLVGGVAEGAQ